jgi:hypothetical protein
MLQRGFGCLAGALLACILMAQVPDLKSKRPAPEQPIPFSHKQHTAVAKLKCADCHPVPEPGDFATLPKTAKCMSCHVSIKTDSPHIAKLSTFHSEGKRIPWAPVYRIPDYVSFSHKRHIAVEGVTCETCHGLVQESDILRREKDISMAACMDCHRAKGASNDCTLCHDQR